MAGKKVSLSKVLAELKSAIADLEKHDPDWSDADKKKATGSARVLRNLADIAEQVCTDGSQSVPG